MDFKKCTVCNVKRDEDNCKKDRNICKNCYNISRQKYNNNKNKRKTDDSVNNIKNQKSLILLIMFQHTKIIATSLLVLAT